jgi:hypothetical protein
MADVFNGLTLRWPMASRILGGNDMDIDMDMDMDNYKIFIDGEYFYRTAYPESVIDLQIAFECNIEDVTWNNEECEIYIQTTEPEEAKEAKEAKEKEEDDDLDPYYILKAAIDAVEDNNQINEGYWSDWDYGHSILATYELPYNSVVDKILDKIIKSNNKDDIAYFELKKLEKKKWGQNFSDNRDNQE